MLWKLIFCFLTPDFVVDLLYNEIEECPAYSITFYVFILGWGASVQGEKWA